MAKPEVIVTPRQEGSGTEADRAATVSGLVGLLSLDLSRRQPPECVPFVDTTLLLILLVVAILLSILEQLEQPCIHWYQGSVHMYPRIPSVPSTSAWPASCDHRHECLSLDP